MFRYVCVLVAAVFLSRELSFRFGGDSNLVRLLSSRELDRYCGEGDSGIYLAIMGQIFDVERGRKHYGPGGAYHVMAGKDASLAFVTGDFTEGGLTDDVSDLTPLQMTVLYDWLSFYQKEYPAVGVVVGRFYSETGQPTEALLQAEASLTEGRWIKAQSEAKRFQFPPCNSQWNSGREGRVWCSTKSGGIQRGWTGVPRRLFSPGSSIVPCVCVEDPSAAEQNPNLQIYDGCPPQADSCSVRKD